MKLIFLDGIQTLLLCLCRSFKYAEMI